MNSTICQKCGFSNAPGMPFCSNCGQSLNAQQPSNAAPPPTMLSYTPNIPTPPPSIAPSVANFGSPASSAPAAKKSNKGILFGLLGCGGLLVVSLIGIIIAVPLLQRADILPQFGSSTPRKEKVDINDSPTNSKLPDKPTITKSDTSSPLYKEAESMKEIGDFKQTDLKTVSADDYYPGAEEVVQATYYKGSKFVISTNGRFSTVQAASNSFNTQIKNVKDAGGQILSNESKDETDAASYKHKGYYFIEVCSKGTCSRNNSSDPTTLKEFVTSFSDKMKASQ